MEKRIQRAKVTFLIAAFVILAGFAVQGHLEARRYQRQLTNTYYHAFTELTTAAGELDSALQKANYTTAGVFQDSLYQQIYAKALAAQYALGELPYGSQELEHTAAFFARTGDYAAALCRGNCDNAQENLAALAEISRTLNGALAGLQTELEAGALDLGRVKQAEAALAQMAEGGGQELGGSTFQSIESDFPELPSLVYDGPFSEHLSRQEPRALAGMSQVTEEEARQAAADFLHVDAAALSSAGGCDGALPTWSFTLPRDGGSGYIEVTKQGGAVLEYFQDRQPGQPAMSVQQGVELAQNYLANWGFAQMESSYHIQHEGALTIHFAPVINGAYCYPDLVKLTVALDNGALLDYEAHGYLSQHRERTLDALAVKVEDAQSAVPEGLQILGCRLAFIPTAGGTDEVLTWEFTCQTGQGSHVLVYVNAATGQQQNILLLLEDESGTLTL